MTGNLPEKGSSKPFHLVVLGAEGVGKTALVVRYLTKRFLSEYASTEEVAYDRTVQVDEKSVQIRLTDVNGKCVRQPSCVRSKIQKVDGIVVVYSVTDKRSYETALNTLDLIRLHAKPGTSTPTMLVGNKVDLGHIREVDTDDAEREGNDYPDCTAMECSAARQPEEVNAVFQSLLKKLINKKDTLKVPRRKVSVVLQGSPKLIRAHIKRRLNMFNKNRNGTL